MLIASLIAVAQAPENVAAGRDHPARPLRHPRLVPRGLDGAAAVGLAIGCRYGVVGRGDRDGRRAGDRDGRDRRRRASPRSGASRRRRPSRSATTSAALRALPHLLDARLVARLGARHARHLARPDGGADRPGRATSATRRRRRPGFAALSGPARLVMLTEQTRDFEAGRHDRVLRMLRRYIDEHGAADARRRPGPLVADAVPDRPRLRARLPRARDRRGAARARSRRRCSSSGAGRSRSRSRSAGRGCA